MVMSGCAHLRQGVPETIVKLALLVQCWCLCDNRDYWVLDSVAASFGVATGKISRMRQTLHFKHVSLQAGPEETLDWVPRKACDGPRPSGPSLYRSS